MKETSIRDEADNCSHFTDEEITNNELLGPIYFARQ